MPWQGHPDRDEEVGCSGCCGCLIILLALLSLI